MAVALKTAYFLTIEYIPMHKYEKFMKFLAECDCPHVSKLWQWKNATYDSETSAHDMLETLATVIRKGIDNKLLRSPFMSFYADESTDIGRRSLLFMLEGLILTNTLQVHTILKMLKYQVVLVRWYLMGFGSDGARAMTGTKEGVTGHLMRETPMLLNYHCVAHRLALVSSHAAASIPHMKEYQEILTGMFYFFKGSISK